MSTSRDRRHAAATRPIRHRRSLDHHTDGSIVARLELPDHIAPLAVHGDELLGTRDELDVEEFVVYRITR